MSPQTEIADVKIANLPALFDPKTVAVIGASRRKESVGYAILSNLISGGFKGKILPINPKADKICGLQCFPSILGLQDIIDLAVIVLPSEAAVKALEECGQKGVKAAIIISAGFREVGEAGLKLEKQVVELSAKYHIPVLGPNCLGLINTDSDFSLNASFSPTMPVAGNIAFISQSGALGAAILDYSHGQNIGFSKFVSLGNKVDFNEVSALQYLKDDPKTDVIIMYVEDLVDGNAFIQIAREITGEGPHKKPILTIKSGRTAQGAKAASSHTGSLMGSDEVYDAIFKQSGVIRVDSVSEIFNLATAFAYMKVPKSNRICIVTNAGGPGIMMTDACVRRGLEMAELLPATKESLKPYLPPTANFSNPIDVIGDAQHDRYEYALKAAVADPNVDSVIVILTPQAMTESEETAKSVVQVAKTTDKTILTCFIGEAAVSAGIKVLQQNRIPHYTDPEGAASALAAMVGYKAWIDRPRTDVKMFKADQAAAKAVFDSARNNGQKLLTTYQSMKVFEAYGFPVLPFDIARTKQEAIEKSSRIGFPVAMKISSCDIVHKLDVGGVKLNLKNIEEVERAFEEMMYAVLKHYPNAKIEGALIQGMGKKGREVILGMNRDARFGPILMFGLGGTYVEVFKDVTFRVAPIRELSAQTMIREIRARKILDGVRGEKPADINAIVECLERLSQLSYENSEVAEIDINPLVVYEEGQGVRVVDARIVLKV